MATKKKRGRGQPPKKPAERRAKQVCCRLTHEEREMVAAYAETRDPGWPAKMVLDACQKVAEGRHKLPPAPVNPFEPRTHTWCFRLNKAEYQTLFDAAEELGVRATSWVRALALHAARRHG